MAEQQQDESGVLLRAQPKPLGHIPRSLAFDAGDVRGFSSLPIIKGLMHDVQRILVGNGKVKTGDRLLLPCQYFNLICGTSTGGLIAITLGRLRMVYLPACLPTVNISLLMIASINKHGGGDPTQVAI